MSTTAIIEQEFLNKNFSGKKLPSGEYDNCTFANCDFTEADIAVVTFLECTFRDCNFTKVLMKQASFRDHCVFEGCKLVGVHFGNCDDFMFSVEFRDCIMEYASFYDFAIKNIVFKDCKLVGVDFTEATITGSVFKNCDLTNAVFEQTNAEKVDFRTAFGFNIDPSKNLLKKAAFSKEGLIGLLRKYDLIIE
ncbi:pentapeptide repeat-containing protein [Aquimarina sp. SS2-1]|uniref:pentapeptide repeat-containing protein n=1 Tax=Aquimarina besae TaxID=3342247 RepID=UPI00366F4CE1